MARLRARAARMLAASGSVAGDRDRRMDSPFVVVIEDFDTKCTETAPSGSVVATCLGEHPSAGSACDDFDATAGGQTAEMQDKLWDLYRRYTASNGDENVGARTGEVLSKPMFCIEPFCGIKFCSP